MKQLKNFAKASAMVALMATSSMADTIWTGASDALDWEDPANWSNGVPSTTNPAVFDSPSGTTGYFNDLVIGSVVFNSGIAGGDTILGGGGSGLTLTSITNNTAATPIFGGVLTLGGNATWNGPVSFTNIVNVGVRTITLVDTAAFSGPFLNFDITSATVFGKFAGAGTASFSGVTVALGGAFANAALGASFDFTTGSFTGATLNLASLPSLADPVNTKWDVSQFQSNGVIAVTALAVIPEPSTWAAIAGVASLGFAALRRRRIA